MFLSRKNGGCNLSGLTDKCCKCEPYEINTIAKCKNRSNCLYGDGEIQWDDKFGCIEKGRDYMAEKNKIIDGVGKDAEIITNSAGGKQSKAPMAMHLVDPEYLKLVFSDLSLRCEPINENTGIDSAFHPKAKYRYYKAIEYIADYMILGSKFYLTSAMDTLCDDEIEQVVNIAKVLKYGADRYAPNNWRLIPEEEHINHALIHIIAHLAGDTQDDHIDHALCRLMMAKSTEKSENFEYGAYVA